MCDCCEKEFRRVREDLSEDIGHLGTTVEALNKRIAEVERLYAQHLPRESVERNSLTGRIDAVEQAIQDTRVDQGEMGLVTVQQENNIMNQLKALSDRLAAVEADTASMRTLALSSERRKEDDGVFRASTHRALDDILDRVSALEARQQDEAGAARPIEDLEIGVRPLREPGDEAGEEAESCTSSPGPQPSDDEAEMFRRGWNAGRRELAREIVGRLRREEILGGCSECGWIDNVARPVAHWIEREFVGE